MRVAYYEYPSENNNKAYTLQASETEIEMIHKYFGFGNPKKYTITESHDGKFILLKTSTSGKPFSPVNEQHLATINQSTYDRKNNKREETFAIVSFGLEDRQTVYMPKNVKKAERCIRIDLTSDHLSLVPPIRRTRNKPDGGTVLEEERIPLAAKAVPQNVDDVRSLECRHEEIDDTTAKMVKFKNAIDDILGLNDPVYIDMALYVLSKRDGLTG